MARPPRRTYWAALTKVGDDRWQCAVPDFGLPPAVADDMHAAVRELRARVQTDVKQRLAAKQPLWPAGTGCDALQGKVPDDVILAQIEVDLGRPAEFVTATISLR